MTNERARANDPVLAFEQIHQIAVAGKAAMNTNCDIHHLPAAAEALFDLIAEKSASSSEVLQMQNSAID